MSFRAGASFPAASASPSSIGCHGAPSRGAFQSSPVAPNTVKHTPHAGAKDNGPASPVMTMYSLPVAMTSPRGDLSKEPTGESFIAHQKMPQPPKPSFRVDGGAASFRATSSIPPAVPATAHQYDAISTVSSVMCDEAHQHSEAGTFTPHVTMTALPEAALPSSPGQPRTNSMQLSATSPGPMPRQPSQRSGFLPQHHSPTASTLRPNANAPMRTSNVSLAHSQSPSYPAPSAARTVVLQSQSPVSRVGSASPEALAPPSMVSPVSRQGSVPPRAVVLPSSPPPAAHTDPVTFHFNSPTNGQVERVGDGNDLGMNAAMVGQYVTQMEATGDFAVAPALLQVTGSVAKRITVTHRGLSECFQVHYGEDGTALRAVIAAAFGMSEGEPCSLMNDAGCHVAMTFAGVGHNSRYRLHIPAEPVLLRPASFETATRRLAASAAQRLTPAEAGVSVKAVLVGCDYSHQAEHFRLLHTQVLERGVGAMRRYLEDCYHMPQIVELTGPADAPPDAGGTGKASLLHWLGWLADEPAHVNLFYFIGHAASMAPDAGGAASTVLLPSDFVMAREGFCVLEAAEIMDVLGDGAGSVVCVFDVGYPMSEVLPLPGRVRVHPCGADAMVEARTDQDSEYLNTTPDVTAFACLGSAATRSAGCVAGVFTQALTAALAAHPASLEGVLGTCYAHLCYHRPDADMVPTAWKNSAVAFDTPVPL